MVTAFNHPIWMTLGGRGGTLAKVVWTVTTENRVALREVRPAPGVTEHRCLGWVRYHPKQHPLPTAKATALCVVYRMSPHAVETSLPTPLSLSEAQQLLIKKLENLPLDPLPIAGMDNVLRARGVDPLASHNHQVLPHNPMYRALDALSLPLNAVATNLQRVVSAPRTKTLTKRSSSAQAAWVLLDRIDEIPPALREAEMVLGQATRNELTHPLGMRLTAAVGWGSGLLRIVRHHVPDFAALRQSFAARPSNHRTCVRAAQLWQGCVDPTTLFEAATVMASIENRWPYGLSRRFKAA